MIYLRTFINPIDKPNCWPNKNIMLSVYCLEVMETYPTLLAERYLYLVREKNCLQALLIFVAKNEQIDSKNLIKILQVDRPVLSRR